MSIWTAFCSRVLALFFTKVLVMFRAAIVLTAVECPNLHASCIVSQDSDDVCYCLAD